MNFKIFIINKMKKMINISELKQNLNIEQTYKEEDEYLLVLIETATQAVLNYLNKKETDFPIMPPTIKYAIIILASQWYENRTSVAFATANEMPLSFKFLLQPYKNITIA